MKIQRDENYIDIDFLRAAPEEPFPVISFKDEENYIEIILTYYVEGHDWGVAGDEYVHKKDLHAICEGCFRVLYGTESEFSRSNTYPTFSKIEPFFTFSLARNEDRVAVSLTVWDCFCDYVSLTQDMSLPEFEEFAKDLRKETNRFPIRPSEKSDTAQLPPC